MHSLQVFSVVDRKVRVELFDTNGEDDVLINEVLVVEGLAERCQEPYESKVGLLSWQHSLSN